MQVCKRRIRLNLLGILCWVGLSAVGTAEAQEEEMLEQWGLSVANISTESYVTTGNASQITGESNGTCGSVVEVNTGAFYDPFSWRPNQEDAGSEWVELNYGLKVYASSMTWDGRDAHKRRLASGIYLYRLQAGDQIETRKLLLLR